MVDFASVYNLANKPTEPFPDWVEQRKGVAQANLLEQAAQGGGIDLQQKRQSMADAMALKQELAGAKTPEEAMQVLYRRGRFKEAEDLGASVKSMETSKIAFKKVMAELSNEEQKHIQASAERFGNQARVAMAKSSDQEAQEYWKSVIPTLWQDVQDAETDTPRMRAMKTAARSKIEKELPLYQNPANIRPLLQEYVDNSKKTTDWLEESKPQDPMAKVNADLKAGRITKEEADKRKEFLTTKQSPVTVNMTQKETFKNERDLREEYNKLVKPFMEVKDAYQRVEVAASGKGGPADIALVYGYMKMLDPGSVVREGEFATAQNAGNIPSRIRAMYNKAITGERLDPDIRTEFVDNARNLYERSLINQTEIANRYGKISQKYGLDPTNIITTEPETEKWEFKKGTLPERREKARAKKEKEKPKSNMVKPSVSNTVKGLW